MYQMMTGCPVLTGLENVGLQSPWALVNHHGGHPVPVGFSVWLSQS